MSDKDQLAILARRRQELVDRRNEAIRFLSDANKEMGEIDFAGKVLARYVGAEWPPAGAGASEHEAAVFSLGQGVKAASQVGTVSVVTTPPELTMPDMIMAVLQDVKTEGYTSASPLAIGQRITKRFNVSLPKEGVSSTVWRMWKQDRIKKVLNGGYSLKENEATDLLSSEDQSAASGSNPAQGGEARPGGGT